MDWPIFCVNNKQDCHTPADRHDACMNTSLSRGWMQNATPLAYYYNFKSPGQLHTHSRQAQQVIPYVGKANSSIAQWYVKLWGIKECSLWLSSMTRCFGNEYVCVDISTIGSVRYTWFGYLYLSQKSPGKTSGPSSNYSPDPPFEKTLIYSCC